MYRICLIFVGLVIFNLMNNIFIYPPTDGYMKKASKISPPTLSPRATKAADATLSGTTQVRFLSIGSARGRSCGPGIPSAACRYCHHHHQACNPPSLFPAR